MDVSGGQMILGLVIGVMVLIFLVLRTKIHAFLALIIAASLTGLIGGMAPPEVIEAITSGFGSTLGSIGIVIGFGVMMGRILEVSGASRVQLFKMVGKAQGRMGDGFNRVCCLYSHFCRLSVRHFNAVGQSSIVEDR